MTSLTITLLGNHKYIFLKCNVLFCSKFNWIFWKMWKYENRKCGFDDPPSHLTFFLSLFFSLSLLHSYSLSFRNKFFNNSINYKLPPQLHQVTISNQFTKKSHKLWNCNLELCLLKDFRDHIFNSILNTFCNGVPHYYVQKIHHPYVQQFQLNCTELWIKTKEFLILHTFFLLVTFIKF